MDLLKITGFSGLIKDYRLQKNISQLEVAFAMGWSEPSRLSRIEQGKVSNPSREFLEKLMIIMKLEEEEKNDLLLIGNYLPSSDEINSVKKIYQPFINNWPYPVVVLDFSWRIIDINIVHIKIYRVPKNLLEQIKKHQINLLEIVFDEDYMLNKEIKNKELVDWHIVLENMLIQFISSQKTRTKEDWYISLIKKMMSNKLFRELWQKAQLFKEVGIVRNFGLKKLLHPDDNNKRLEFTFFIEPLMIDPRFQIELHVPANKETFDYFK
ncbi:MAG: hypothetical protein UR52_C0002G0088 [Candidatus Gottesmanbacteria bacterium GW2011_GWA1_34_13]|uniref:HTH cro/C1-type domain-containing protein n=1 Tax=Candidatus Gottesmanbacteria bacterium GW2011_GWA1_34_13 TaxID=1618434 RepID=A0A0G0D974_9BACT|nr:MAG: hypothetical protein UR52_C0002G0088 [Candidatus Gottesmanbacteria bacterium GW2011_GWA1_34_13]